VRVLRELYGVEASSDDFLEFTGTGEANFLGGVAQKFGVGDRFDVATAKARFVELYLVEAARPETRIAYPGQCGSVSWGKRRQDAVWGGGEGC